MVLQTRLSGKAPGVPWDVRKVQGMGGCGESRKAYTKDMVSRDRVNRSDYVKEG